MEGNIESPAGSPVKVHFMSTQFMGGMQYISFGSAQEQILAAM
jgi:hypothetical protein